MSTETEHPNWRGGAPTVGRIVHFYVSLEVGCQAAIVVEGVQRGTQRGDLNAKFRARVFDPDGSDQTLTLFVSSDYWHWPTRCEASDGE